MALEIKLVCNVEIVLSADEAVRSQMKFWNDNHTLMYFNMVSFVLLIVSHGGNVNPE